MPVARAPHRTRVRDAPHEGPHTRALTHTPHIPHTLIRVPHPLPHRSAAQHGNHTLDYTMVTRDKTCRVHKSLPVEDGSGDAISSIAAKLQPFLSHALGARCLVK